MNTELTHAWVNKVLDILSFHRRYLVWDSYECHIENSVKSSLHAKKFEGSIVPAGCTKYIQTPDASWDKPFKAYAMEMYDQWLADEGIHQLTSAENLKPPLRRTIVNWILEAWEKVSLETIKTSFKSCALNLNTDGSEDDLIHCFKEKEPCKAGREILKSQLSILTEKDIDPFEIDDSDVATAAPEFLTLDEDNDVENEDIL